MIWITRAEADAEVFAAKLGELNIKSIVAPVMRIEPVAFTLGAKPEAIVLTSRNAANALPAAWSGLPVYCVGKATAKAAHEKGYSNTFIGTDGALDLLPLISEQRILYLSGEEMRVDLPTLLSAKGKQVERQIVYRSVAEGKLSPLIADAIRKGKLTGVVFFSPKAAAIGCKLAKVYDVRNVTAYCLSVAVAQSAGALPWKAIRACATPSSKAMLALLSGN